MTCRLAVNLLSLVPGDVGGAEEYAVRTLAAYGRHGPADLRPVIYLSQAALDAHRENMKGLGGGLKDLLAARPDVKLFNVAG